ncbi:MAG TPA: hypothetical protein VHL54_00740 [Actinomycetota bacterium]|nr:hypothetical protein [Actinomycetota bacterium]
MLARSARMLCGILVIVLTLAGCNTEGNSSDDPTTGTEAAFEVTGDVSAVDIEDVDFGLDLSTGGEGVEINPSASVTVQLTVNIESVNREAADLCGLEPGSDTVIVVTDETDLALDRPLEELGTIQDESIRTTGTARELSGETAGPDAAVAPAGSCRLDAQTLALAEEAGSPSATP